MVLLKKQAIVIFDGDCALCNRSMRFIKQRDKKKLFRFVPNQSDESKKLQEDFDYQGNISHSVVLIYKNKTYDKSEAVLKIVKHLSGGWPFLYVFKIFPVFIRDYFYNLLAKNRHLLAFR